MAYHNYGKTQAFKAGEALTTLQNHFVKISAANTVVTSDAGENAIGVNVENAALNETTGVMCESGSLVEVVAGAVVAAGAQVASDADGKAITAVDPANVLGIAVEAAAAEDDLLTIIFSPQGKTILDT